MNPDQNIFESPTFSEEPLQQESQSRSKHPISQNPAITSDAAALPEEPAKKSHSWTTWFSIGMLVLAALHAFLLLAVAGVYFWLETKSEEVISTTPAGHAIRADQTNSLFPRGVVETDSGYFFLISPMYIFKGDLLSLEVRGNGDRYLCDARHACTKLL